MWVLDGIGPQLFSNLADVIECTEKVKRRKRCGLFTNEEDTIQKNYMFFIRNTIYLIICPKKYLFLTKKR